MWGYRGEIDGGLEHVFVFTGFETQKPTAGER